MLVDRLDNGTKEKKKLSVFIGVLTGCKKVNALVGSERPVIVLTAAVDALEGLFLKDANKTVAFGNLFHRFHR